LGQNRIGVFGGTFDPIHIGHLIAAEVLRIRLGLGEVQFLPAGMPPHKPEQILSSNSDRLAMLELAIGDTPDFSICRIDIDRDGPSYTADTVELLKAGFGDDVELYFLMGHDSLRDLPRWHQPWRITQHARLGVARRPGVMVSLDDVYAAIPSTRNRIDLVDVPLIGVSSTDIRQAVATGGPFRFQVMPAVADYIVAKGLYDLSPSGQPGS
jgi:nicotinate-nucleotide adenylyltransferase